MCGGDTQAARKRKKKEQEEKKKGPGYLTLSLFGLWGLHSFVTISCTVRHDSVENTNSTLVIKILNVAWVSRVQKAGRKKQGKEQDNGNHLFL